MLPIRKIFCPTDFSDLSIAAFELASALARDYNAELMIAHVSPTPIPAVADGMVIEIPSGWEEETKARLRAIQPSDPSIHHTHHFSIGEAGSEIVEMASELKADLIVVGTHGRSGLSRLLMGSTAEFVMRHAPCPVLTVRHPSAIPLTSGNDARDIGKRKPAFV